MCKAGVRIAEPDLLWTRNKLHVESSSLQTLNRQDPLRWAKASQAAGSLDLFPSGVCQCVLFNAGKFNPIMEKIKWACVIIHF